MIEGIERNLAIVDPYAAALFELAREGGRVEAVRTELDELVRAVETQPAFAAFLASRAVDEDDRRRSLERMFRGRLSDLVLDTLLVMNAHGRAHLLAALRRVYELRQEDAAGQVEVVARSAVPLAPAEQAQVQAIAAQLSGRKPLVRYQVEPDVLGGLILELGDYRYDYSLRRQLRALHQQLWERGERGFALLRARSEAQFAGEENGRT